MERRLWLNLAQLCVWALQTPSAHKISQIWKIEMVAAAILKNWKIIISSQPIDRFWQNLACRCVSTLWILTTNKILRFQKSKMAAAAILKIQKIAISPPRNDRFWRNLAILKIWNIAISPQKTDFDDIWYNDAYCPSEHRQPITFCKFNNSW